MSDSRNTSHWVVTAAIIFVLVAVGVSMWRAVICATDPTPIRPAATTCVVFRQVSVIEEVQDCKSKGGKFFAFQHTSFADDSEYLHVECVLPEKKITDEQIPL